MRLNGFLARPCSSQRLNRDPILTTSFCLSPLPQQAKLEAKAIRTVKLEKSEAVESALRNYLLDLGFTLSKPKQHGETGCDLVAIKGRKRLFIEVIGFQSAPPTRSKEFFECFFRAVSRDQGKHGDRLVMALPIRFARGKVQRKRQYGIAWEKIGNAFPNLEIWYVDTHNGHVVERSWTQCVLSSNQTQTGPQQSRKIWDPQPDTIGILVKALLQKNRSFTEIRLKVLSEFPSSRFNRQHYSWYKNRLK